MSPLVIRRASSVGLLVAAIAWAVIVATPDPPAQTYLLLLAVVSACLGMARVQVALEDWRTSDQVTRKLQAVANNTPVGTAHRGWGG